LSPTREGDHDTPSEVSQEKSLPLPQSAVNVRDTHHELSQPSGVVQARV
jgi:hypothetical protein